MKAAQPSTGSCGCRLGQYKRSGLQERLLTRFPSAQGVEGDAAGIQVHLTPHQPMRPERVHGKRVSQQLHRAMFGRAPQIDDLPPQRALEVPPPPDGKRPSRWSRFDADPGSLEVGGEIARRASVALGQRS